MMNPPAATSASLGGKSSRLTRWIANGSPIWPAATRSAQLAEARVVAAVVGHHRDELGVRRGGLADQRLPGNGGGAGLLEQQVLPAPQDLDGMGGVVARARAHHDRLDLVAREELVEGQELHRRVERPDALAARTATRRCDRDELDGRALHRTCGVHGGDEPGARDAQPHGREVVAHGPRTLPRMHP